MGLTTEICFFFSRHLLSSFGVFLRGEEYILEIFGTSLLPLLISLFYFLIKLQLLLLVFFDEIAAVFAVRGVFIHLIHHSLLDVEKSAVDFHELILKSILHTLFDGVRMHPLQNPKGVLISLQFVDSLLLLNVCLEFIQIEFANQLNNALGYCVNSRAHLEPLKCEKSPALLLSQI